MKRLLASFLAFALACPPGILAGTPAAPAPTPREAEARDFREGRPLEPAAAPSPPEWMKAREEAVAVQKGRAPGENDAAYEARIRAAARGLGLQAADADAAVQRYMGGRPAGPAGARADEEGRARATLESARKNDAAASARANALARALASGASADAGTAAGSQGISARAAPTPDQMRRLNAVPAAQGGPRLGAGPAVAALPAVPVEPSWSERAQNAASEKLRAADAVPDDGGLSNWAQRRWLQTQGVGQFIAGKAADGATWSAAWTGAKDVSRYPTYVWNGGKAVVEGFVGDFANVYTDGARFIKNPSAAKAADLGVSTGLVAINFVGLGIPALVKTGAKTAGTAILKESVEVALKDAAEAGVKSAAERSAARAGFREANAELINGNLKIAGSAERTAAVRAQMPGLGEPQVNAVLKAHEAFPCAGAACTQADLRGKYEIMSKAGMSPDEIRETLDRGLAGKFTDWLAGRAEEANKIIGPGTGAFEGVTFTVKGEALALSLKAKSPVAAIPLGEVRQGGMLLRSSQNGANARIVAEYSLLMKTGKWDWARGARIEIGVGQKGENVILEGHHRVMAAQLAGVKIPESAFLRTRKPAVAFDWSRMSWFNRIK
ncbi:MAG: hypothetical protein ACHQ51_13270 [Elusimicrobiota bacterium]